MGKNSSTKDFNQESCLCTWLSEAGAVGVHSLWPKLGRPQVRASQIIPALFRVPTSKTAWAAQLHRCVTSSQSADQALHALGQDIPEQAVLLPS